jgi:hypothetical protein
LLGYGAAHDGKKSKHSPAGPAYADATSRAADVLFRIQ